MLAKAPRGAGSSGACLVRDGKEGAVARERGSLWVPEARVTWQIAAIANCIWRVTGRRAHGIPQRGGGRGIEFEAVKLSISGVTSAGTGVGETGYRYTLNKVILM